MIALAYEPGFTVKDAGAPCGWHPDYKDAYEAYVQGELDH
jgi:hypothetical protein